MSMRFDSPATPIGLLGETPISVTATENVLMNKTTTRQ